MNTLIKQFVFTVIISLLSIPALAQNNLEIPLSNPGQPGKLIVAANFSDEVQVRVHDKDNVIVNYDGQEDEDDHDAMRNGMRRISGGGVSIDVTEDNNEVRVNTGPMPNSDLEMIIYVPRNFSLKLNTIQGDVMVTGLKGELEISAVNGDVELLDISGTVLVNSVNGDIEIDFNEVDPDSPMSFTGVNGDIDVSLPANAKFTAKMKTEWGEVLTNFDMDINRTPSKTEENKDGEYRVSVNKWITGKVNGGGPEYLFKTLHGDISIRKK
ncbi:MAG: hypothetical protein CL670_06120 [Balneola sp.]|jgi:hypothetical protein|nr:hypothetical protein [Balneola sp.]MBE78712.1 hypothetical protein [Balneola sp.]|tara:strand:- start:753 stop:1556 length:804 start_codon:yes stop_codon:yes gene_type:complete